MTTPTGQAHLIEPNALEPLLYSPSTRIVQVCSKERFEEGHVPGAYWIPPQALIQGIPPVPGMTPSLADINNLLNQLQITPETTVVALDDEGGGWAGRLLWTLAMVGHERWQLLNGGLWAWAGEGFALSQGNTEHQPPAVAQHTWHWAAHPPATDASSIKAHLQDPTWVIWDARSSDEYQGLRQTALRSGHIPGAKHYEWTSAMDQNNHLKLRALDQITNELSALGITADRTVVTHCQSHHRSGFTWALGRILGFNHIIAYPGSWAEWGNSVDLPVETATQ